MINKNDFLFCTIITSDYIHYARALHDSLLAQSDIAILHILVIDNKNKFLTTENLIFYDLLDLKYDKLIKSLITKYASKNSDAFRWGLKPFFLKYLLNNGCEKILYTDCDVQFFDDYKFLFDLLDNNCFLLSPHNRSLNPYTDEVNFVKNFTEGIYNGGFVGASSKSMEILNWWSTACLFDCSINKENGVYVDQKYLDIIPARFSDVYSLKHLGCNIAGWNIADCKREWVGGKVLINATFPIVFIHFASGTCELILFGNDELLKPYLLKYAERVKKFCAEADIIMETEKKYIANCRKLEPWQLKLRRWLSVRKQALLGY